VIITSVSPSTGSQFSMLPPENATRNWVKVVQRVPVRLQLTHLDAAFLLQAGLSAIAMFIVGRMMGKIDIRLIIGTGCALCALASWQMTRFDLQMDSATVVWSGASQGLGTGFVYVPLAAATFATLTPALRNEGTAIFNLTRNIGGSVGISVVNTLLTRNTQIIHATLSEHVTRYSPILRAQLPGGSPSLRTLAGLNTTVKEQAAMIAYNNDFQLTMLLSLAAIPLVFLLRKGRGSAEPVHIE
jgi:MFS transporter, DHA2 family, multidrug resistance protein